MPNDGLLFPELGSARHGDGRRRPPLFLPRKLEQAARDRRLTGESQDAARTILLRWAELEAAGRLDRMSESQLQAEFLTEVFGRALGYTMFSTGLAQWSLWPQFPVNSGTADAALGHFTDDQRSPRVVIELKGPTVNVDRDRSAGRTPVRQCWDYLADLPECPWGIVCNYVSFRLYHRDQTPRAYELFTLQDLRDEQRFREFYYLFERGGLLRAVTGRPSRAEELLAQSALRQREVGDELYATYHEQRTALITHLQGLPHGKSLDAAIRIAQRLLDRIIFIAFCQDRRLLPNNAISRAATEVTTFSRATNPLWQNFRDLFGSIDRGNERAGITPFNGGLFAHDPEVDDLELEDRWPTFFKEIGTYDFEFEVNVDVLGRLFEQSITDIENLRAEAAGQGPATAPRRAVGRRRREGIYYTPPHVTRYIVAQTVGTTLGERCTALAQAHRVNPDQSPDDPAQPAWTAYHRARLDALRGLRVCDPACGSGAFLIQAYDFLEHEYEETVANLGLSDRDTERERDAIPETILRENLFGVDLSEEAVELTRLALWIRTARVGKTLADLSRNIVRGNSLVDDPQVDPHALDWSAAFPRVFRDGGFDCVISNPPYVKLQNFRRRQPEVAAWLPGRYRAARTGNYDMYLPFIERGLGLLRPAGRMGYIAPNLWLFNEYGRGLRELIAETRGLERFVDFKSHQVFPDATTYTALQFFTAAPRERIAVADAGTGDLERISFYPVEYPVESAGAWALLGDRERTVLDTMRAGAVTLADATEQIFQGLITSADAIYHLVRLGPRRYYSKASGREVELEDAIMRPLISGEDAVPYATPATTKYLLFPYDAGESRLLTEREMTRRFPRAWAYLRSHEEQLRGRESGKMDREGWYGYVYPKNIEKHEQPKLLVPRLLLHLFAGADPRGAVYLDNVDVGGILLRRGWDLFYILGVLNSKACDYAWRLTSKPFRGEYRSANKQFIAPLPIPQAPDQKPVATLARELAKLHGRRLAAVARVHRRFATDLAPRELIATSPLPPSLPQKARAFDTRPVADVLGALEDFARRTLTPRERAAWDEFITAEAERVATLRATIRDWQAQLDEAVNRLYGLTREQRRAIEDGTTPVPDR